MNPKTVVLASESPYRLQQLRQIGVNAEIKPAYIDEAVLEGETPKALAIRLARAKAEAAASNVSRDSIVIAGDQVASLNGMTLGKPGSHAKALKQLTQCSGKRVIFYSAICVGKGSAWDTEVVTTEVAFRALSKNQIEAYLEAEPALDCAGSFKCEGLGIGLFTHISSDDPSALVGLPLITTVRLLAKHGYDVLLEAPTP